MIRAVHQEAFFRWGSPGTDFAQMRWPAHAVFAGPLLPHKAATNPLPAALGARLTRYGALDHASTCA